MECVSPDAFPKQIAYTALGHIHKSQRVSGRDNIRYAGSPLPMSFAEKNYHHGVVRVTLMEGQLVEIEKIEYNPMVGLLSVPNGKAAVPEKVIEELEHLPSLMDTQLSESEFPYLEIKIMLSEPEPVLRQRIEEILVDKAVRLARIVSSYRQAGDAMKEEVMLASGLQEMNPLDIVKATFEKIYQVEMSEELEKLFNEAMKGVINENTEHTT